MAMEEQQHEDVDLTALRDAIAARWPGDKADLHIHEARDGFMAYVEVEYREPRADGLRGEGMSSRITGHATVQAAVDDLTRAVEAGKSHRLSMVSR